LMAAFRVFMGHRLLTRKLSVSFVRFTVRLRDSTVVRTYAD
jgi:hypothetical protein